ncbi:MAG: primosomal protein N' [Bacteroidota bacterium]
MPLVVEVVLPLAVKSNFHYLIDESLQKEAALGKRVLVNFGKNKIYTGVIRNIIPFYKHSVQNLKRVEDILDDSPSLNELQLQLFEWIAYYYMCTEGEVLKAALPAGMKPESSLRITMKENLPWQDLPLDNKEWALLEALSIQPILTFQEVASIWQILNPRPRLNKMEEKGFILQYQEVEERYKPKLETYLKLASALTEENALREAFDQLSRSPTQENLLMQVVSAYYQDKILPQKVLLKEAKASHSAAKALIKKGILAVEKVQVDRLELYGYDQASTNITLTEEQQGVEAQMQSWIEESPHKPILLHGITGSGKTHIYIRLIKSIVAQGKQALYLLPEITLTKQIIDRVKAELGDRVGVYHSKFSDAERVEIWQKVLKGEYDVVIGVRSAIFLPFTKLGIIVIDEEHDNSFKQHEPAPRYNARDVGVYYGSLLKCPVILGSATPSFESYQNALSGKYRLAKLTKRAIAHSSPSIQLADMRIQRSKKLSTGIFSSILYEAIVQRLEKKEQVILFQNRRGYAPYLLCETCGNIPQCINCDISLTYHKGQEQLRCHYCGYTLYNLSSCGYCGNHTLKKSGIGTEKIEEQIQEAFPDARVARMDLDTTRSKMGFQTLIHRFEKHEIDILVGTQMVSKGLDFGNVTLVGVIAADGILSFPDFRTDEKGYQLLKQVAGRSGRSEKKGEVIIQTHSPDHPVLQLLEKPYEVFYKKEIPVRNKFAYPPYTRLLRIEIHHKDRIFLETESLRLFNLLKPLFGSNLLGPEFNLVPRVRNVYRMHFLIKLGKHLSPNLIRKDMPKIISTYYEQAPKKSMRILLDVDPL